MNGTAGAGQSASGDRSVAAHTISGAVATGDNTRIVMLEPGTIPAPAQVTIVSQVDNLPRPPAPVFTGRDTALGVLGRTLAADASVVITQAVYGLGGVGKSELALQHAHAHRGNYQLVWWITATDTEEVEAGLAALAGRLCPPVALVGSTQDAAAWALGWLQGHNRWLLILDNVDDPADVAGLLGQLRGGHIVVTTRRDVDWQRIATPVRLDILDPEPAAQIITARTGHTSDQDHADATACAAELGFLPLALDQAAAYMIQSHIRPGQYLDKLHRHPARMYAATAGQAQQTITRLWDITIDAIRGRDPDAIRLLQILACYAPDNIPRAILGGQDDTGQTDDQLALLASYSMITLTGDTASIHRLVWAVTRAMPPAPRPDTADTALEWLDAAIPPDPGHNVTGWPLLRALIPHADAITGRYPDGQQPLQLGRVHNEFALFYQSQGDYRRALVLRESALRIYQAHLEPDHPDVATALGNLAVTYSDLGRAGDALPLEQRALQITEAALGPDHPDVAIRLGNLAVTYKDLGRAGDALPLFERAQKIRDRQEGPNG
jgi:tetratricopeptide (TPR) repeat protein